MAFDDRTCWLVRAGRRARLVDDFVAGGIVAVGEDLPDPGDLGAADDADVFLALEAAGRRKPADDLRDLRMFTGRMADGDVVVVPDPPAGDLLFGELAGAYAHRPGSPLRHVRPVRWFGRLAVERVDPVLAATATDERAPIRRLPEQVGWLRLAGEVDDVLGRPVTDVRRATARAATVRRGTAGTGRRAGTTSRARSGPAPVPDRICSACGLLRAPTMFPDGDDLCRDCA